MPAEKPTTLPTACEKKFFSFFLQNISATSLRFAPQIIVLADAEDGQLESSFLFSYGVKSPDLLASEITSGGLGAVVAEEAFNPHPVSTCR